MARRVHLRYQLALDQLVANTGGQRRAYVTRWYIVQTLLEHVTQGLDNFCWTIAKSTTTMSGVQGSDSAHYVANGTNGVKRESPPAPCDARHSPTQALTIPGRRGSTVLNARCHVKQELWKQAPILIGSTNFEPLPDAKNILITGGAGFMYVATRPREVVSCASLDLFLVLDHH